MLLLGRRWLALTLATIAGQLTVFLLMLATLRVFGVDTAQVGVTEAFAAWSVGRLIGSLPFMPPGGIGVVEIGLTGLLIGFGGNAAEVTAAVLIYRALTIVPTLVLGSIASLTWRRHRPGRGVGASLEVEQRPLALDSAGIAGQCAVRSDQAVARDDHRDRVGAVRGADCPRGARPPDPRGQLRNRSSRRRGSRGGPARSAAETVCRSGRAPARSSSARR